MKEILDYEVAVSGESWKNLEEVSKQEVEAEFARRFQAFEGTVADKIYVLLQMLGEYTEVIPGTNQPVDNSKRFHVEEVAILLKQAEQDQQKINKLTTVTV